MTIEKKMNAGAMTFVISGRLDTQTAPALEKEAEAVLGETKELIFDMTALEYISSAGLRVLLKVQKGMNGRGNFVITGANEDIKAVFDVTGFTDILTIR